ncbi:DUF3304 domain-containing protein [Variovorax dokdonensis]|uniref:DUF3304 domain-containing protein n=1 Tax=Variovorax dokdonensis TaxID=344883 RepID=A0ABT7NC74_9BURK|nr:DUF3304 domain-containing protein [Variovorax dokdonensis]MDM0045551.1 DUF3304 domain-containing protein [Variovorax dokdonensis]
MNQNNDTSETRADPSRARTGLLAKIFLVAALASTVLTTGCASRSESLSPRADMVAVPVMAVAHYGAGIVITEYSLGKGVRGGFEVGWGGGGGGLCCVLLPRAIPTEPMMVTVKWETNRQKVKERLQHEVTVPVHFDVPPGKSGGIYVHFLPGHRVELWIPDAGLDGVPYMGPPDPRGPAPLYEPLPDEKPWPPGTTAEQVRTK